MDSHSAASLAGRQLGSYHILTLLGAGGMGEVYRAHDPRLGRDVAIKLLPASLEHDAVRLKRFEHEARVLAALNHPSIGAIYELEEAAGVRGLVLELVEGPTLAERIASGPIRITEAMNIARQVADALQAAHAKGIIHRDLKPANIKVTPDGRVKVLDFGLAKVWSDEAVSVDFSQALQLTTITAHEGWRVGTPAYMSPEQACGKPVDTRTDIWAFGCILFEMLTGTAAFRADSPIETISRVLEQEPHWTLLPHTVPALTRRLLKKCLEKPVDRRLADIVSARMLMEDCADALNGDTRQPPIAAILHPEGEVFAGGTGTVSTFSTRTISRAVVVLALVLAGVAAGAIGLKLSGRWKTEKATVAKSVPFAERDWLLIADLDNQSGDQLFDKALNTALGVSIGQSSYINIVPPTRVQAALRRMKRSTAQVFDAGTALELALREGVRLVLAPSLSNIAGTYLLSASLLDPSTGAAVTTLSVRAQRPPNVLSAVDELANGIRLRLGEASASVAKQSKPLYGVTTSSLEALRLYSAALEKFSRDSNFTEARALYENALRIDPSFTAAKAQLGMLLWEFFDPAAGKSFLTEAVQHADDLTDAEKYSVLAFHATIVENDAAKAIAYWKALLALYPDRAKAHNDLGRVFHQTWRLDEAIVEYQEAIRLDPYLMPSYFSLNSIYLDDVGEVDVAVALAKKQISFNDRNVFAYHQLGWGSLGLHDLDAARAAFQKALQINPRFTRELYDLAHTCRLQRKYPEALQALLQIKAVDAQDVDWYYSAGVVSGLMADQRAARNYFEHFRGDVEKELRKDPTDAARRFDYAVLLARLHQDDRARLEGQKALSLPRNSRSVYRSSVRNFPPPSPPEAMSTDAPDSYFDLARLLNVLGKKREAIEALEKAVEKGYRNYIWIKIHEDLESLTGEPRFEVLLRRGLKTTR